MGCILTKNKIKVTILIFLISASLSIPARAAEGELREMSSGDLWDLKEGYRLGVVIEGDDIVFTVSKNGQELKNERMKLTLTASFFYYRGGVQIISIPTMIRLENNRVQLRLYQRSDNGIPLPVLTATVTPSSTPTPIGTVHKASTPFPQITLNSYPSNITLGQKAIIMISGKNNGGNSPEAYFSVSFPDNPNNVRIVSSNAPNYNIYKKGMPEWGGYGEAQFKLEYPHAEGWAIPWPSGIEYSLTVEVIPEKIGTFYFFVKMTAKDSGLLMSKWLSDPSSSDIKDQQNEYIRVYSINVQQSETLSATLTVDDSGGASYKKIQDAINEASNRDTILVYSGTYYENIDVNKRLVLRGIDNGGGKPVVDAGGRDSAILLSAGDSTLDGFTVVNAGNMRNIQGAAGISVKSDNNIIRNNTASSNEEGIRVEDSSKNRVSGNTASNNYLGIYLHYSNNNTVNGNTVSNNRAAGIYLWYSNNNIITGNYVSNNSITINESSNYNILYQNNFVNNYYNAHHDDGINQWDNGINIGNYWGDYTGIDTNKDDIGDTPYVISSSAKDRYPLMAPYEGAILQITPIPTPTSTPTIASSLNPTFTPIPNVPLEKSYIRLLALMPMMFLLVQYIKKFSK